jgi:hypothetical protein
MYEERTGKCLRQVEHILGHLFLVGFVLLDFYIDVYDLYFVVCSFVLFLSAIVLSVLRYTDSDYPFGIFKHFLLQPDLQTIAMYFKYLV